MPPHDHPPAAMSDPQPGPPPVTDVTYEARMLWPYLDRSFVGSRVSNGRELGCWLAGHFLGRQMHGEVGLRVEVPEEWAAGTAAVLLDHGLIVQRYTFSTSSVTLDVWAF